VSLQNEQLPTVAAIITRYSLHGCHSVLDGLQVGDSTSEGLALLHIGSGDLEQSLGGCHSLVSDQ
jgi:hypothetical protein